MMLYTIRVSQVSEFQGASEMIVEDIYGFQANDIEVVANLLADVLDLTWVPRRSSYSGDYYTSGSLGGEHLVLRYNYNSIERAWRHPEFTEYPILLYANNSQHPDRIRDALLVESIDGSAFLSHKEWPE